MPKKKSLSSEEALDKLCKQGWLVWLKSDFLKCKANQISGTRTIEIDPPDEKEPRLFIYHSEKIVAHVISWQKPNTKENVVRLQKEHGWTLGCAVKGENKAVFIISLSDFMRDIINIPVCHEASSKLSNIIPSLI